MARGRPADTPGPAETDQRTLTILQTELEAARERERLLKGELDAAKTELESYRASAKEVSETLTLSLIHI